MDKDLAEHVEMLSKLKGKRIVLIDRNLVSSTWTVTTDVPPGFWNRCKAFAIPIKPYFFLGFFPTKAFNIMLNWKMKYGESLMVALIPDEETEGDLGGPMLFAGEDAEGHTAGPILIADLDKDPSILYDTCQQLIRKDETLSDMKRRAALMLFGWSDFK